jgi:hypothetical protein
MLRPFLRDIGARLRQRNQRYRLVFAGAAGAFVRDDLFRIGHVGRPTYVPGDPAATAFNEGKRFMALHIAAILDLPDATILERAQAALSETHADSNPDAETVHE